MPDTIDTGLWAWLRIAALALTLAALPLAWWWVRNRRGDVRARLLALALLTTFLTFDLIVFGAFTRLTDSGLGCPDWPGCYGHASPLGAHAQINEAQAAQPSGPVTHRKAWIEMIHRYLAMTVGALIIALLAGTWRHRRVARLSLAWPVVTLLWVIVQGLFGKYTVTWKLQPGIVTLHLLGGMTLLALLVAQCERLRAEPVWLGASPPRLRAFWAWGALAVLAVQMALGAWVSSNYAVLACQDFPTCQGQWWPAQMDFKHGFALHRELGRTAGGDFLPMHALVAIHVVHRAFAVVALMVLLGLAWACRRHSRTRPFALWLGVLAGLQLASGMGNVVLGWPLAAALVHTAGAAAMVVVLVALGMRLRASGAGPA